MLVFRGIADLCAVSGSCGVMMAWTRSVSQMDIIGVTRISICLIVLGLVEFLVILGLVCQYHSLAVGWKDDPVLRHVEITFKRSSLQPNIMEHVLHNDHACSSQMHSSVSMCMFVLKCTEQQAGIWRCCIFSQ